MKLSESDPLILEEGFDRNRMQLKIDSYMRKINNILHESAVQYGCVLAKVC